MKRCTKCGVERPLEDFHKLKKGRFGRHPKCRFCRGKQEKERYKKNPREKRPYGSIPSQRHGLNDEDYAKILEQKACLICGREVPLVIDHDHETGIVRGRLCVRCNTGLGKFLDDPEMLRKAAVYLERCQSPAYRATLLRS